MSFTLPLSIAHDQPASRGGSGASRRLEMELFFRQLLPSFPKHSPNSLHASSVSHEIDKQYWSMSPSH